MDEFKDLYPMARGSRCVNAPVHPQDIQLENIKLQFSPPNTTAVIQPMDWSIIRTFKAYYRRFLVKHIITDATVAMTAEGTNITALDAVHWIEAAWNTITETSIRNIFRSAGFEKSSTVDSNTNGDILVDNKAFEELNRVLKHLTIGGKSISAYDYIVRSETEFSIEYSNVSLFYLRSLKIRFYLIEYYWLTRWPMTLQKIAKNYQQKIHHR